MSKLLLEPFAAGEDIALLLFRLCVGCFLIWGVSDNILSAAHMDEFVSFLAAHGFVFPEQLARVSVWGQFACGVGFALGLLSRLAGILCAVNFLVAVLMVDAAGGIRQAFPATMLVFFGVYVATRGAGRFAIDQVFANRLKAEPIGE